MIRRSPAARLLGAFLALWLALAMGEPSVAHVCPMHGGLAAAAPGMMEAGHGAGTMEAHHGHDERAPTSHHDGCSCLGDCAGGAGGPMTLPTRLAVVPAAVVRHLERADAQRVAVPRARVEHALPFANGPPAGTLAA